MPYGLETNKCHLSPSTFCAPVMASDFVVDNYKALSVIYRIQRPIIIRSLSWKVAIETIVKDI